MKALAMVIILQFSRTMSERVCKGETNPVCLNPSSQTIIVAEGSTVRISLGSEGLYPCAENNCESDKIQMAHQRGPCTLDFNRDSDRMERGNFYGTGCDQLRSDSWAATTDDPDNPNDVYLKIESAHPDDSGVWTVTASNGDVEGVTNAQKVTATVQVWVASAPQMMSLVDEAEETFNATLNQGHEKSIFCKATKVRPDPTFFWTVDGVDIANIPELANVTIEESTSTNSENTVFNNQYLDVKQELKFPVIGWLDNKALGCRIEIKDNSSIDALPNLDANDEKLNINVTFYVRAPPVPSTDDEINPEGSFEAGEEGVLFIHFHANPPPTRLSWYPADMTGNLTSTETNMTVQAGRYVSEGWVDAVECVNATDSSSSCPSTYSESNPRNAFIAVLKISELTEDDQNHVHTLKIKNDLGETTYSVRIQTIEVGLTTGAIAGIVVGCIVGVVLIAAAILMFVRHRNGKKSKKIRQRKKESRAEERTDRL